MLVLLCNIIMYIYFIYIIFANLKYNLKLTFNSLSLSLSLFLSFSEMLKLLTLCRLVLLRWCHMRTIGLNAGGITLISRAKLKKSYVYSHISSKFHKNDGTELKTIEIFMFY